MTVLAGWSGGSAAEKAFLRDVRDGLVSPEAAEKVYGVKVE